MEKKYPAQVANAGFVLRPDDYWQGSTLDIFARNVVARPDATPLHDLSRSISFRELDESSTRLARILVDRLDNSRQPVALLFDKQVEIAIAMLAALKAGKYYAPIEPAFPLEHMQLVIEDLKPQIVITSDQHAEQGRSLNTSTIAMDVLAEAPSGADVFKTPSLRADDPLYVIYTSGSTGRPKGVSDQHAGAIRRTRRKAEEYQITEEDRVVFIESSNFGRGQASIWDALLNGNQHFMFDINRAGVTAFADWCNHHQITQWAATPGTFRSLVSKFRPTDRIESMKVIRLGGEMSRPGDFELFKRHFSAACRLAISYGMSEASGITSVCLRPQDSLDGDTMPVGYAYPNREILVMDENEAPLPYGQTGEVHVRLDRMTANYLDNPEASKKRFYPDPERPGRFICRTGDLGWQGDDGCLYLVGRVDHQIKIRGMKVNTADVTTLLATHPDIADVHVRGQVDARGNTRLVAYIVSGTDDQNPQKLRQFLEPALPTHMIPVHYVYLDQMPMAATGKLDWKALPGIAGQRPALATPFVPPKTDLEMALATIWREVLGIDSVGLEDPFLDLGGDSLMAAQVFAEVEKRLGAAIPPGVLFSSPTIASLAAKMESGQLEVKDHAFLLPIRQGKRAKPVVCFLTPIRGDVMAYIQIIEAMDPHLTIYGLNSWLLKLQELRKVSLPELAATYIEELLKVDPEGPYVIGGHSFAGRLAYEMARQLTERRMPVPFIFMFDASGPDVSGNSLFIYKPWHFLDKMRSMNGRQRIEFFVSKFRNWQRYWGRLANMVQVHTGLRIPRPATLPMGTERMREIYIPQPQPVNVVYFRADYDLGRFEKDLARGWKELVQGNLTTHIIHDNHYEMLKGETGAQIGRLLMESIAALESN